MCIRCHQAFTDDQILDQLTKSTDEFELWNHTSISHLCIAYIGFNGKECSDVAKVLLDKYVEWAESYSFPKKEEKYTYFALFGRPTALYVREEITKSNHMKEYVTDNNLTKEQILEYFDYLDNKYESTPAHDAKSAETIRYSLRKNKLWTKLCSLFLRW